MERSMSSASSSDDYYYLDRLFDPEQLYYTPMDELLKRYATRDLRIGRMFNLSKKYGHMYEARVRKIVAPQMERAGQRRFGNENFYYPPPKAYFCTKPKSQEELLNKHEETVPLSDNEETEEDEELSYNEWLNYRKKLRSNFEMFNLNIDYLKRKKDLTEMEKNVLRKLMFTDKEMQTDPVNEKNPIRTKSSSTPKIVYPTPIVMEKIESFLGENKWRLIDLFKDLDKNKDWKVLKSDFMRECKNGRLNASDTMIEELVNALGADKTNYLNYKSLVSGRTSHLIERRNQLRESDELRDDYDDYLIRDLDNRDEYLKRESKINKRNANLKIRIVHTKSPNILHKKRIITHPQSTNLTNVDIKSEKSRNSSNLSMNSQYLQLPPINTHLNSSYAKQDRGVSVASSSLDEKTIENSAGQPKKTAKSAVDENKMKMSEIRSRIENELNKCLRSGEVLKHADQNKLKHALTLPKENDVIKFIHEQKNKLVLERKMLKKKQQQERLFKEKKAALNK